MSRGYYPLLTTLVHFQHECPFSSHLKNAKKKFTAKFNLFVLFLQILTEMRGNIPPPNDTKMQHIQSHKYLWSSMCIPYKHPESRS